MDRNNNHKRQANRLSSARVVPGADNKNEDKLALGAKERQKKGLIVYYNKIKEKKRNSKKNLRFI